MKIIAEASKEFWDDYVKMANVNKETAMKSLEDTIRKRLELREGKDIVEIREV